MMIPPSLLDLFSLKGRTALVTGGSKGLGEAMACALSAAGADVALTSRNEEEARAAAAQISAHTNGRVLAFQADAADRAQVEASVRQTSDALGPIDILVNNAGINIRSPIVELRDEDWDAVIAINLTGPMYYCRAVGPQMIERGYGRVINLGSTVSQVSIADRTPYASSKGGIVQLTKDPRPRMGTARDHRQRHLPRPLYHPDQRHPAARPGQGARNDRQSPHGPLGRPGRASHGRPSTLPQKHLALPPERL